LLFSKCRLLEKLPCLTIPCCPFAEMMLLTTKGEAAFAIDKPTWRELEPKNRYVLNRLIKKLGL